MNVRKSSNPNVITGSNSKDSNNNVSSKASKEKEKEKAEIIDLVGNSKSAFVVRYLFLFILFIFAQTGFPQLKSIIKTPR